jgi:hypothetical protein
MYESQYTVAVFLRCNKIRLSSAEVVLAEVVLAEVVMAEVVMGEVVMAEVPDVLAYRLSIRHEESQILESYLH